MLFESVKAGINNLVNTWQWSDLLDIALMSYFIYELIKLVRRTRALQLVKGILFLVLSYALAAVFELRTVSFVLQNVFQVGLLAIVIVFQPELRRALERVGRGRIGSLSIFTNRQVNERTGIWRETIASICDSAQHMSDERCGALIAIERATGLGDIMISGTAVDARVTPELLETIFYEGSPLHDGAVVIRDGRVAAAGCLLPLSSNEDISRDMGTRHRAALGMSENSDALVVVVSEETGIVSLAQNGVIIRRLDRSSLYKLLANDIIPDPADKDDKRRRRAEQI